MSLVELLVTIIVAGIAFLGIVPLFLSASQQGVTDNFRNVTTLVAQQRLEMIRTLDYDQLFDPETGHVPSATLDAALGNVATTTSGGVERTFTVTYTPTLILASGAQGTQADWGYERYIHVSVKVSWTGKPTSSRPYTVLSTDISRQYGGPTLTSLTVAPQVPSPTVPDQDIITTGNAQHKLEFTATIATADTTNTAFVEFYVRPYGGSAVVAHMQVTNNGTAGQGQGGVYIWNASTPSDGVTPMGGFSVYTSGFDDGLYRFSVVATSKGQGLKSLPWEQVIEVSRGAPAMVTGLVATPGDAKINLTWNASSAGDLNHYEIWRSTTAGAETLFKDDYTQTTYMDQTPALTNGTTYYYYVVAVDNDGNPSPNSAEASATPVGLPPDGVPTNPSALSATVSGKSVALSWTGSVDQSPPATPEGMKQYIIWRSVDNGATWIQTQTGGTATAYSDTAVNWNTTYLYKIQAQDLNLHNSVGFSNTATATIGAQALYALTVRNNINGNGKTIYVTVKNAATGHYYNQSGVDVGTTAPAGVAITSKGGQKIWSNLPADTYTVTPTGAATSQQSADLNSGPKTITYN